VHWGLGRNNPQAEVFRSARKDIYMAINGVRRYTSLYPSAPILFQDKIDGKFEGGKKVLSKSFHKIVVLKMIKVK
jgi:hypothetical protein